MITDARIYNKKNAARNQQEEVLSEMFLGILMKQRRCFNKRFTEMFVLKSLRFSNNFQGIVYDFGELLLNI